MAASIHYSGSRDVICILDYKGKRVLMHQLLPEGMKKSVCVFMLVENGVALSISFVNFCRSVSRHRLFRFSIVFRVYLTRLKHWLSLAVKKKTKEERSYLVRIIEETNQIFKFIGGLSLNLARVSFGRGIEEER